MKTEYLKNLLVTFGENIKFDYNLKKMFKKNNSPIVKEIKHWLNYFHFPAPAIRLSPELEFYLLFL